MPRWKLAVLTALNLVGAAAWVYVDWKLFQRGDVFHSLAPYIIMAAMAAVYFAADYWSEEKRFMRAARRAIRAARAKNSRAR